MDTGNTPGLFENKLSEEGTRHLRKFLKLVRFILLIGILISALSITSGIYSRVNSSFDYSSLGYWHGLYLKIFPFYQFCYSMLFLTQIYFYWKISQQFANALKYDNEISFNQAFRYLYLNAIWALITMSLGLVFAVFELLYLFTLWG